MIETRIDVRYTDCDGMGIVHHAVYPVWYEMARMDLFEKSGFGYESTHALGLDPAMVHLELDYCAPVTFPGSVTVRTRVTLCEGKKLGFSFEVRPDGAEAPCAKASSFHIWVKGGKSFDLEREQPDIFAAYRAMMD
ncbi:MAG: acyl-CoA thioesterase [Oscillospiraceae bacterium]|nr:acyl-CoA thioesterase [Oscillospiraceae bacterium]